ncbi:hypothetical protein EGW08_018094 [Elysia chlorotica]|uniref:Uncharacterized protein n=1 Tax=Elysia chlorotica TaxID=188477 RepID=A0A433SXT2_ELYCH|nr:hypothetical protein EGW08_018094 [Elysia chlorotica]
MLSTKSQTEKTELGFLAISESHAHQASQFLFQESTFLLEANTWEYRLKPEAIKTLSEFETMIKSVSWMSARLCTCYGKKKNKGKNNKVQAPSSIHLTLSALTKDMVLDFIHNLQLMHGSGVIDQVVQQGGIAESQRPQSKQPVVDVNYGENSLKKAESLKSLENEARRSSSGVSSERKYQMNFQTKKLIDLKVSETKKTENAMETSEDEQKEDQMDSQPEKAMDSKVSEIKKGRNATEMSEDVKENQDPKGATNNKPKEKRNENLMEWDEVTTQTTHTVGSQGFQWLFLSETKHGEPAFTPCSVATNIELEKVYSTGTFGLQKISEGYVDLDKMIAKGKDKEKPLLRVETFDSISLDAVKCPEHWCKEDYRTCTVEGLSYEFLYGKLQNDLKPLTCDIIEIEALENPMLFKKFRCKQRQTPGVKQKELWHRVSAENMSFACQYGFHYNFMAIPPENVPEQRSVCCFFEDAQHCLSLKDVQENLIICLVRAVVLIQKEAPCHTISSDAEAYPMYFITLRVKRDVKLSH